MATADWDTVFPLKRVVGGGRPIDFRGLRHFLASLPGGLREVAHL
jgi:hypothetical protein